VACLSRHVAVGYIYHTSRSINSVDQTAEKNQQVDRGEIAFQSRVVVKCWCPLTACHGILGCLSRAFQPLRNPHQS
jgi:hypothetical protein